MGAVVGHWKDLTEAQKLTNSQLIKGVFEEDIKLNNPIERVAVALALGKSVKWNREKVTLEGSVQDIEIGEKLTWVSNVEYNQKESELVRKAIPRILDNFVVDVYGTEQNYEAQALWEIKKGMMRKLGDSYIYDDNTYGSSKQMKGLHQWASENCTGGAADGVLDIDQGSAALSIRNLRLLVRAMKYGIDYFLIPPCLGDRIDAAYEEAGLARLKGDTAGTMMHFTKGIDQAGNEIMKFKGIPLIRTDYLVSEDADTGRGTTARTRVTGGVYSIFAVKSGDIFAGNPGVTLAFGNPEMKSKLYKVDYFDKLEDYDAKGIRLITYPNVLLGSKLCLGRIHDITDAEVVY